MRDQGTGRRGGSGRDSREDPVGSFYMGRMQPPGPKPRRQLPRGFLSTVMVAVVAGVIWYAYPEGPADYDTSTLPVVTADTSPYKFKPEDPGGIEVLHQDSTVFNPIESKPAATAEKLMPLPEAPVNKTEVIEAAKAKLPIDAKAPQLNLDVQMMPAEKGAERIVTKAEIEAEAARQAAKEKAAADKAAAEAARKKAAEEKQADADEGKSNMPASGKDLAALPAVDQSKAPVLPAAKPAALKEAAIKKEKPPVATAEPAVPDAVATATGAPPDTAKPVYLRLGSYREASGASSDWQKLSGRYPQYLKNLQVRILKTDLNEKGIYYRLEAGKLSETRAKQICDILKAGNPGGCMIIREK